jgi:translation initiation factor 4G
MLSEYAMHDCLSKLLRDDNEESLECFCKLLSTIGKQMDSHKAKVISEVIFILEKER